MRLTDYESHPPFLRFAVGSCEKIAQIHEGRGDWDEAERFRKNADWLRERLAEIAA